MKIQRRFEPSPEALDRVAEILYALFAEASGAPAESGGSAGSGEQTATCLHTETEG
jgi:hypothetical protein